MSIHDGPGIRTTVFLKGCNLRCQWCHNPETWSYARQIQFIREKCIECLACVKNCPQKVWSLTESGITAERERCTNYGNCKDQCYTGAIQEIGEDITIDQAMNIILQDKAYYDSSGGGVTLSGGEPLLQDSFCTHLLRACKSNHIQTAIESNLSHPWKTIEPILPWVDLWMCDLKLADNKKHKEWTGSGNDRIISNLKKMASLSIPVIIRTPIIPGVNDNEIEMTAICNILRDFKNIIYYELLPFHPLGNSKFDSLGIINPFEVNYFLDKDELKGLYSIPVSMRIPVCSKTNNNNKKI